ncbi:Alpha/Beta hydrolase protein [Lentinula raphanica]|nr:Alpha/Beta hydrolase protein [Lentinula raphanica]
MGASMDAQSWMIFKHSMLQPTEHFTYWDSAIVALQVMDHLGIQNAFVFGASHGGWIVARMALLAPDRILGLMLTGTSMDCESDESRKKGAWNTDQLQLSALTEKWYSATPTPSFVIDDGWCEMVHSFGFGKRLTQEQKDFWTSTLKSVYKGDEGRKKLRVALICLIERDGLLLRLRDIKCPGTQDKTYPPALASEHIKLFTSSKDVKFDVLEGGCHYLTASHPIEVGDALKELSLQFWCTLETISLSLNVRFHRHPPSRPTADGYHYHGVLIPKFGIVYITISSN